MTSVAGPSLAFYFEHGLEFDALAAMEDCPEGVSDDAWTMFEAVFEHATNQVFEWVRHARKAAVGTIPTHAAKVSPPKGSSRRNWFLWARLEPAGAFTLKTEKLYLGVSVGTMPEGVPYFAPYFATGEATSRDQLAERLRAAGFDDAKHPGDWFSDDAVTLKIFPLDKSTDLDAVTAQSTELFEQVVKKWDVVFRR